MLNRYICADVMFIVGFGWKCSPNTNRLGAFVTYVFGHFVHEPIILAHFSSVLVGTNMNRFGIKPVEKGTPYSLHGRDGIGVRDIQKRQVSA